jgi:nuclear control of ATPase protein 2
MRALADYVPYRRIERLLIGNPEGSNVPLSGGIGPRTTGLLLLSTTHLRAYAERHLPARSRLRDGFLEDVTDLEKPNLGVQQKLRVVDRMWNSWGRVLGWYDIAEKR